MPPTNLAASLAELQGAVLRGEDRRSVIKAFHKTHNKHAGYLVALRTVNVAALLGGEVTESRMQLAELVVRSSAVDALQLMQSAPVVTSLTGQAPALDLSVQRVICAALSSAAKAEPADAAVDSTVPSFVAALFKYLQSAETIFEPELRASLRATGEIFEAQHVDLGSSDAAAALMCSRARAVRVGVRGSFLDFDTHPNTADNDGGTQRVRERLVGSGSPISCRARQGGDDAVDDLQVHTRDDLALAV